MTSDPCPDDARLFGFASGGVDPEVEEHIDRCAACFDAVASTLDDAPEDELRQRGESTGRYTVLRVIGEGAMGTVYAGYDPMLDRTVALKVLRRDRRPTEDRKVRLLREAQVLAKVRHPNVVTVYDAGESGDTVYLAMELVDGIPLDDHLRSTGSTRSSWRAVLALFTQAGRGLGAAHLAGLVHRDFKPSNVLVTGAGRVVVTDFGLAAVSADASPTSSAPMPGQLATADVTVSRTALGTPAYMAPEALAGERTTTAGDQFSFCVALVEALAGQRPFTGQTVADLRAAQRRGPDPEVIRRLPGPRALARALIRGLSFDPGARHPSMASLLTVLRRSANRRRDLAIGAVVLAGALGVAVVSADRNRAPEGCAAPLSTAWGERRQQVEANMHAGAASPLIARLDTYAAQLQTAYDEVCPVLARAPESTRPGQSNQWVCLESRRVALEALTESLAMNASAAVSQAPRLIDALAPVRPCRTPDGAAATTPVPTDDDLARAALELRLDLARLIPRIVALDDDALEGLAALGSRANELGYLPVHAEVEYQWGRLLVSLGRHEEALPHGQLAYDLAARSRHEDVVRAAATGLMGTLGALGRHEESDVWTTVARPLHRTDAELAKFAWLRGGVEYNRGEFERARAQYEVAYEHLRSTHDTPLLRVQVGSDYGITLSELGRTEDAVDVLSEVITQRRALLGADHVTVARDLANLGAVEIGRDRYVAAAGHLREALGAVRRAPTAMPHLESTLLANLAIALAGQAQWTDSSSALDEAATIDTTDEVRAHIRATRAGLATWRGDYEAAVSECAGPLDQYVAAGSHHEPTQRQQAARCLAVVAEARRVGERERALAASLVEQLGETPHEADGATEVYACWVLGLEALERDGEEAERWLERARAHAQPAELAVSQALISIDLAQVRADPNGFEQPLKVCGEQPTYRCAAVELRAAQAAEAMGALSDARALAERARDNAAAASAEPLRTDAAALLARLGD